MGDLEVCVSGQWTKVNVKEFNIFNIGSLAVKIPTLSEMRRILLLFGREKDLRRIEAIDKYCE